MTISALQQERAKYQPRLPESLYGNVKLVEGDKTVSIGNPEEISKLFPLTYGMPLITFEKGEESTSHSPVNVGVILSGGQAPGGHNVIAGIFDGIKKLNPECRLYGFLGGPGGLVDHKYIEITADYMEGFRNTGGFDIIGSGRTKLDTKEQFDKGLGILRKLNIGALVIIGGDDSNTNACILAEYYLANQAGVQVIGCPKTIDGDLKNEMIETSFGFDTAVKVYSELIGNIERDSNSARKYWHFIKLMGRSASHIGLECALQTQPNICLISEEVQEKNQTLSEIVDYMACVIATRACDGNNFGVALIPEGLIEFIPEMKVLIGELNDLLVKDSPFEIEFKATPDELARRKMLTEKLSEQSTKVFESLPAGIANQLTLDRDDHGNLQVSLIQTEMLLGEMVKNKLKEMKKSGCYKGKFSVQYHFFGYEGRCAAPSNFDADYCYSLGFTASVLIGSGKTGYMASVRNLTQPVNKWIAGGVPITMMMNIEWRQKQSVPVIQKALVRLDGAPFATFAKYREKWARETLFVYPGPIQYFGPSSVCDQPTQTLLLEHRH
jgi:diphosphate-dependent phosphofructokinase